MPESTEALPKGPRTQPRGFRLLVMSGPDSGVSIDIAPETPRTYVGTSVACTLRLADKTVSRRHIAVEHRGDVLRVRDLESTNGVMVSGVRVYDVACRGGETLELGATRIRVSETATTAPSSGGRRGSFGRMLGGSEVMRRLYGVLERASAASETILVEGEAGTGKELVAETLHEEGPRSDGPFLVCDATMDDAEALLFGGQGSPGLLEQGDGGTLFVDEVTELSEDAQARLAAWIAGAPHARQSARVIVGSRRDVDQLAQRGAFRDDLATLLCRHRIELPPLRERSGDVRTLALHFWRKLDVGDREIPAIVLRRYEAYGWPGNVRELEAAIVKLATTGDDAVDPASVLRDPKASLGEIAERLLAADLPLLQARGLLGDEFDRRYLRQILARHGGNVSRAAGASGLARRYFQMLKTKLGVDASEFPRR